MLVLSRRADQKIVFPSLNIKLEVLQIRGQGVKIGIEAPQDVPILRGELFDESQAATFQKNVDSGIDRHQLRNRLNTVNLGLRLLQKQTEVGMVEQSEETLQRVVNELAKLDTEIGHAQEQVKQVSETGTLELLVVEDDDNERELLAGLLRLHGFNVHTAASGDEALNYLNTHAAPDYVLLDMKMPKVDGPSTIRQIRENNRLADLKIFAVSGTSPNSLGVEQDIYSGWFPKPLDPERLIQAMTT